MYVSIVKQHQRTSYRLLMLGPGLLFVPGRSHHSPTEPLRTLQTLFRWQDMASLKPDFFNPFLLRVTGVRLQALVHRKVGKEV